MLMLNSPFRIVTSHKLAAGHLRMAPEGLFQGLPACGAHDRPSGPPRSPWSSCRLAKHFHSRARLCRLLVGLRPPTLHRSLRSLRQGGFAHYVRLRHYRSSLFCCRKIIPSHSFAALAALIVRHVKATRPLPALTALIVRRVKAAQPLYPLAYYFKSFPTVSFHCFVSGSKVSSVSSAAGPTYILHLFPSGRPISLLPPRYAFSSSGYWKISNQY